MSFAPQPPPSRIRRADTTYQQHIEQPNMNAGGTRTTAVRRQGDWYSPWIDRQKYKPTEEGRTTDMDQPPGNKLKGAHSSADHKIRAKGVTRLIPSAIPNVRRRGMVRGNLASLASYWSFVYLPFYQCKAFCRAATKILQLYSL